MRLFVAHQALLALAWCLLWAGIPALAQDGGDLQAQILYAWQSGDMNRLQSLRQSLQERAQGDHASINVRYHLAHADYRIALLRQSLHQSDAARPLQDCVDQLSGLLRSDPASAEAMILEAACYVQMAPLRRLQSTYMYLRARQRLARAEEILPGNPRAALVGAKLRLQEAKPIGPISDELIRVARLFDGTDSTNPDAPGWGHAEAFLMLGHALRVQGNLFEARNWIEKALIVAPDYKAARMELALLAR